VTLGIMTGSLSLLEGFRLESIESFAGLSFARHSSSFRFGETKRKIVNTPLPTNVYHLVGILRAWPGPETEVTCWRQAFDLGL
jgi:hypothetical protein